MTGGRVEAILKGLYFVGYYPLQERATSRLAGVEHTRRAAFEAGNYEIVKAGNGT